jgi:ubiquitin-activating enzyme E1
MEINYELYDRQIRTYGVNASIKINNSSVLCIGLKKGLATEVLKNLVIMGVNKIYLLDNIDDKINESDLLSGYYYSNDDLYKKYYIVLSNKLKELNPLIEIIYYKSINKLFDKHNDINVIITINDKNISSLNELCRNNKIKMISLECSGNNGLIFVDVGENHLVTNITGENYESVQIINIEDNIITTPGHEFQTDDTILLSLNNKEYKIEIINKYKIKLIDYNENINFINGTISYVDIPVLINHKKYSKNEEYNYIKYDYEIISVNSIMGSLVASETIKLITNKYMPINQWFFWEDKNLINYDLSNSEVFIVGSGAIGCELLKNLAFLNVKKIILTDPDIIEKSNLSRQFLFREKDIGKLKSEIASLTIKKMKPNIEIEYYSEKVGEDNIKFTKNILSNPNLTCVFNALDNIAARKFMDIQCFNYNLPLFESGTMGVKGNIQPIIPFLTETYSNTSDPDNEKTYPVCTIKNFPSEIHHTIHWALDQFEFFNRGPKNLNLWLSDKNNKNYINDDIVQFTTKLKILNCYNCVLWAIDLFHEYFNNQIIQLLTNFPPDTKTKDGLLFWSAGKRCPFPIQLDPDNNLHLDFIESTTNLLCKCLNLKIDLTRFDLYTIIENNKISNFVPKNNLDIASNDTELDKESKIINTELNINNNFHIDNLATPIIFEKDDDTNYHIKFITSASNLRAINYSIEPISFYKTKGIAGKIIPAIATTTSIVAGLITNEFLKYLSYKDNLKLDKFNSTFINLATNLFISAEPNKANTLEIANQKFNSWHKFIEKDDLTLNQFIKKYNELFKVNINIINLGNSIIYADFLDDNINKLLSNIIKEYNSEDYILTINSDEDILLPDIIIKL